MQDTATTPAADAVSAIQALIDDEAQYLCVMVAKAHLTVLLSAIASATARESALIAERDALRDALEEISDFTRGEGPVCEVVGTHARAALSAPAVEWV